jgi:hypothetical protein
MVAISRALSRLVQRGLVERRLIYRSHQEDGQDLDPLNGSRKSCWLNVAFLQEPIRTLPLPLKLKIHKPLHVVPMGFATPSLAVSNS